MCADKSLKFSVSSWLSSELHCKKKKINSPEGADVSKHTAPAQSSGAEERSRAGKGREKRQN